MRLAFHFKNNSFYQLPVSKEKHILKGNLSMGNIILELSNPQSSFILGRNKGRKYRNWDCTVHSRYLLRLK